MPLKPAIRAIDEFLKLETASSILLLSAAILALIASNSFLSQYYQLLLNFPIQFHFGDLIHIDKPLLLWINDGLMAIFFFVVGLELKREIIQGQLSKISQVLLPVIGAVGGMLIPALIYAFLNRHDPTLLHGWAIPAATDIAFSLGVLALLGSRVPNSLKVFLMALAIIDDLGAIIIIALFYSGHELHLSYLYFALGAMAILALLNLSHVRSVVAYLIIGLILWVCVLKSGIHATIAGVTLAIFIPLKVKDERDNSEYEHSPLRQLEHTLHPWVAFGVMPIFAFANAGVAFEGMSLSIIWSSVPLGIILGLSIGKLLGVFGFSWITIRLGFAQLPEWVNWQQFLGVSFLCGIGFTMSLFIGSLTFSDAEHMNQVRLGVLLGSLISAIVGYLLLVSAKTRNTA
ncbi:MAG: Na+/H+ antiporter NhaA [Pseudomonadota bacterium]|nr:Na+/H+ antiporter NhaA [Pseudomonadota bacterium]